LQIRAPDPVADSRSVDFDVGLNKHHLEGLSSQPTTAILELIWNALDADADADRVEVAFVRNELGGIEEIKVLPPSPAAFRRLRLGEDGDEPVPSDPTHPRHIDGARRLPNLLGPFDRVLLAVGVLLPMPVEPDAIPGHPLNPQSASLEGHFVVPKKSCR
jgi:hypothetical protein